jgi:hypothetical protein
LAFDQFVMGAVFDEAALAGTAAPCPSGQTGTCVYAVGGGTAGGGISGVVESYNPATNAWSTAASLPTPRNFLAAAAAPCPPGQTGTCVYAIGGFNASLNNVATVERYNPATNAWSPAASLPAPRSELATAAAPCPPGQVGTCADVVGGFISTSESSGFADATAQSYNPTTNAWTTLAPLPTARADLTAATAPCPPGENGVCVYAVGGDDVVGRTFGTVEALDPPPATHAAPAGHSHHRRHPRDQRR